MIEQKVQIRFAKGDAVRFISHHDLMRLMQRALRRAALPVRLSEGFNPRPRVIFPQALEVGVESLDEVAELELTRWVPPRGIERRLGAALPAGIELRSVVLMAPSRKGRAPVEATYELDLAAAGVQVTGAQIADFLSRRSVPYGRARQGALKQVDLRPLVRAIEPAANGRLLMRIALDRGTGVRPREVLAAITGRSADELLAVRTVKTRTRLAPRPAVRPPD